IVFMGTPEFAACFLKHLKESDFADVVAVVTQPDRPAGRGRVLTPPPVKSLALEYGLPVLQPLDLKSPEFEAELRTFNADLFVVVAFSILPRNILGVAKFGAVNVHGSMLPKYRGAAPVQRAIADGLLETGVTVFRLDEKMDHGPILSQKVVPIGHQDTTASILEKMVAPGCEALDEAIQQLLTGTEKDLTQDHALASGAPKLKKEEGLIDFNLPAKTIHNRIRAFNPWPGGYGKLGGRVVYLRVTDVVGVGECQVPAGIGTLLPGAVAFKEKRFFVGTGEGILEVIEIQAEGKKPMPVADFMRGIQNHEGLSFC
ncbi:MAG: methionyl-tRNA formyltransferase, partial [Fibrobacter sp.]|nr:methionyl-tRNA formyltransferase [Fibrobacter sp.]